MSKDIDVPNDIDTVKTADPYTVVTREAHESYVSCGNCGKSILPRQKRHDVFNSRKHGWEHYHEDYTGCYESTRPSPRRVILNRFKPWLNTWLDDNSDTMFKEDML